MKKTLFGILTSAVLLALCGCSQIGDKSTSMSVIYGATTVFSLLLLIGYCCFIKKKEVWFLLLFSSVFIVNIGYFSLSISQTLEEALLANRISYLGSVFLPFSMVMTVFNLSGMKMKKWIPGVLLGITIIVFFIAASPGYLDIYYKSVSLEKINGMSVLKKEYGAWHSVYLYYLLSYFAMMIGTALHAVIRKKIKSGIQSTIVIIAVFVNICVWLLEQLVAVNFEFLSVSYIISELFLLSLHFMIQNNEAKPVIVSDTSAQEHPAQPIVSDQEQPTIPSEEVSDNAETEISPECLEKCEKLQIGIELLTATERKIFEAHVAEKPTKDILRELGITENTLKFHNKNLYHKLGVTSKKQLQEYVKALDTIKKAKL